MNYLQAQDNDQFNKMATTWLKDTLLISQFKIVQLPAGNTPLSLYNYWEKEKPYFLKNVMFQQLDDIITGPKSGKFSNFFKEYLPSYANQFIPLSDNPIYPSIAILGVGNNGHIAFHEPEINLNFNYGCVKLSSCTCKNLDLSEPTWGISYGTGHLINCNSILIIAKGETKKAVLQKALTINKELSPVSYLLNIHPLCTLLTDKECAIEV